jgi:TIR domain/Caspase domain
MPRVFISYRRSDSQSITGRIYDRLVASFGKGNVFKDVDSIPPGIDFRQVVNESVERCEVLIAVIGAHWLDAAGEQDRNRLSHDTDFVRLEIEAALRRGIPVIPVLVEGGAAPKIDQLPISMKDLAYRHASHVRHDPDFHHDMDRLIQAVKAGKTRRRRLLGARYAGFVLAMGFLAATVWGIVGQEGRAFRRIIGLDGPRRGGAGGGGDAEPVRSDAHADQSEAAQPVRLPSDTSPAPDASTKLATALTPASGRTGIHPGFMTLMKGRGVTAVLSCAEGEVSCESDQLKNGLFSHFLIQGLKEQAKTADDQGIELVDLFSLVRRRVVEYSHRKQIPQMISNGEGDVAIMRRLRVPSDLTGFIQGWAVLVGVNLGAKFGLRFACQDALDLKDALVAGGYRPDHVYILTDDGGGTPEQTPTKSSIIDALRQVSTIAKRDEEIIVAFSGSGVSNARVGGCLLPSDGDLRNVESLVLVRDVFDILEKSAARRKVVFIDACRLSEDSSYR